MNETSDTKIQALLEEYADWTQEPRYYENWDREHYFHRKAVALGIGIDEGTPSPCQTEIARSGSFYACR